MPDTKQRPREKYDKAVAEADEVLGQARTVARELGSGTKRNTPITEAERKSCHMALVERSVRQAG